MGGTPKLRRLTLDGCLFHWKNVPPSSVLTHLRLSVSPAAEFERPTADDFFHSLGQMPLLNDVYLANVLPLPHKSSTPARPPVELSNLAYLVLKDSVAPVIVFFGGVRIPKRPNIEVDCRNEPVAEEMGQLLGKMAQSCQCKEGSEPAFISLIMEEAHFQHFQLELVQEHEEREAKSRDTKWGTQGKANDLYTDDTHPGTFSRLWSISISFGHDRQGEVVGDHINTFTQSLSTYFDLAHLKYLHVESDCGCSRSLFQSAFGHLTNLASITFMRGSPRSHLFGLLPIHATDEQSIPPAHPDILFPALHSLVLETRGLGRGTHCEVGVLIQMLLQRLEAGPLLELDINACSHIEAEDVDRIKASVPGISVRWDHSD